MIRAALYARYSSDRQKETSIADQISMARKHCEARGWTVVAEHSDAEMTGKNARRPGFQALKHDIRAGKVDVVVIEALDRMTRRVVDALTEYEMFEFRGVKIFSLAEGEQDFLRVLMLSYGAQAYSQSIAVHTERGRRAAFEKEQRLHSLAYGYRKLEVEDGRSREIAPDQAAVVRRIFEETAAGKSSLAIARDLNRDGIPSPRGGAWSDSIIRGNVSRGEGILRNTLYIGQAQYGATHRTHDPETGMRKVMPTPDKLITEEIPELRIVPQEDWDAAQARMALSAKKASNAGNARASHRTLYLLSGLLVCDCCGAPYVITGKDRYGCRGNRDGICTNKKTILRGRIEGRVFGRLRESLLTPELAKGFEAALRKERKKMQAEDSGQQSLKHLRSHHRKLGQKLGNLFTAIEEGASFKQFETRIRELESEIAEVDIRITEAEAASSAAKAPPPDPALAYAEALRRFEELLGQPDFVDQAHELLATLIHRITLRPDTEARHGMAAEILWDLGSLLSAGGYAPTWANRFAEKQQLTVRSGGWPPALPRALPPVPSQGGL